MKIVISDYKDSMMPSHDIEFEVLRNGLGEDVDIVVFEYDDNKKEEFYKIIQDADALLTAFIQFDKEMFDHAPNIKVISINATGYDNVDLSIAKNRHVGICPVGEYCTIDVAEYTISLILSLVKNLKIYGQKSTVNLTILRMMLKKIINGDMKLAKKINVFKI